MDELGFNKIAAAILATGLGFMGLKEISHSAMHVSAPDVPAYRIAVTEAPTGEAEIELPFPQADWIAAMDAERGAKVFKKCTSCHNAEEGGSNGTGPNLWNVVGTASSQKDGFGYSAAMKNSGITWDYETLDGFLTKPTKYLSGTAMNFVGLKKEGDRAAVIEYLRQQSGAPVAQPMAAIVETGEEDLGDAVEAVLEDGAETLGDAVDNVTEGAEKLVDGAQDMASDAVDAAGQVVDDAVEAMTPDETPAEHDQDDEDGH